MKKFLVFLLIVTFVATMAVGCSGESTPADSDPVTYEDGVYFAQESEFGSSGWKYYAVITVADGQITDTYWGGTNIQPVGDKQPYSEAGLYGMEWHSQAVAAQDWLIENQDPAGFDEFYIDEDGHTEELTTDAGTAVSIHVKEYFELAKQALDSEPVPEGTYTTPDNYVATATIPVDETDADYDPENAWEYRGEYVVVNGTIMSSNFNAVFNGEFNENTAGKYAKDDEGNADENAPLSKKELGMDYGMDWKGNAEKCDAFIVENQGFPVEYKDEEGHTDSITGVSIHVMEFETLFKEALGL
ncbi:MAG: hypothetical protein ACOWWR_03525 [Eubacteriales bacterium]